MGRVDVVYGGDGMFSGPTGLEDRRAATRLLVEVFGWSYMIGGSIVLFAVGQLADRLSDPTNAAALAATGVVTALTTVSVAVGTCIVAASAASPHRHVFRARFLAFVAVILLAGLVASVWSLVVDPPMRDLYQAVEFGASDVVDIGRLVVTVTWFAGTGVVLGDLRQARRNERDWSSRTEWIE